MCLPGDTRTSLGVAPASFPSILTLAPWGTELTVIEMLFGGASGCNSRGRDRATTSIDVGVPEAPTVVWNFTDCPTPTLLNVIQPSPIRALFLSNKYRKNVASEIRLSQRFSALVSMM